jgi:outer membrane protein
MKQAIYLMMICTFLSVHLSAQQNPQSFSLQQAVEYAKKNNYSLKNNQLDVVASQKKVKEILASGLPQINANGNFTNNVVIATQVINFNGINTALKFGQPYTATGSITGSQLLFDGGFLMGVKAAKEYVALSEINVNRGNIETEVNVTKAYYGALLMQTNAKLLDQNLQTLEKTRSDLEKAYGAGLVEKTDFDRVTLQYSSLELQKSRVVDQERITMMVLKLQMGMNVNDSIILTDELQKMYETTKVAAVEAKVDYTKRTEYQLVDQQIKLNTLDKKRYQYGYAPSLSAVVGTQANSFGQTFSDLGDKWYPGTYWGLNLSVPIFDGLRKSAQIQQSRVNIAKAENDRKNLENAIDQEVLSTKLTFQRAGEQLKIQERNMALAQEIYDRVQIKYKNGVGSSLELTTSQNDLETARTNYLATVYDYFVAQVELRKALGDIK